MFEALIRKDLRICRLSLVAGVVLLLGPYGMAAVMVMNMPLWTEATPASAWAVMLGWGSFFSVACSQATLGMVSGSVIATERGDRSAEFLAYLPPARRQILQSKFAVLAGTAMVIYGVNLSVRFFADALAADTNGVEALTGDLPSMTYVAAVGVVAVGVGWCSSAALDNAGPAVALAFAAPLIVLSVLNLVEYLTGWPGEFYYERVYFGSSVGVGVIAFVIGTVYYLQRIEP